MAAFVFLELHDVQVHAATEDLVTMVESVAQGALEKPAIARWLEEHTEA